MKLGCRTNEVEYSCFFQLFSLKKSIISSLKLSQAVWVLVFREAKKTSSQATPTKCSWGHRVPVPSRQKAPGDPRDGMRRVPVPFPSHSQVACLGKQYGLAPGLSGSAVSQISQKTVSGVLFLLAALELSPDFGERSVGAGCQPGGRHGAPVPCLESVVGMRLPHPFPPGAPPPLLRQDFGAQLG